MNFRMFPGAFCLSSLLLLPVAAQAQACKAIEGRWTGTMTRDGQSPTALSMDITAGCDASWSLPNQCRLTDVDGGHAKYHCSRGSVGTVRMSKSSLTWRNTETGPMHGFYTISVRR